MQLTKNFHTMEFDCRNGVPVPEKYMPNVRKLAANLQILRDEIGESVHINSGYRTPAHNKKVGGKPKSQHLTASAADIVTRSYTPKQLAAIIEKLIASGKMQQGGLGIYPSFVHYDVRKNKARW